MCAQGIAKDIWLWNVVAGHRPSTCYKPVQTRPVVTYLRRKCLVHLGTGMHQKETFLQRLLLQGGEFHYKPNVKEDRPMQHLESSPPWVMCST